MIIIIDGYNLLKQVFPRKNGLLDKQRKQFIKQLGYYKAKKKDVKEIIVVFDGGLLRHATREISNGIVIVFSGQKRSADEWILDYVKKHKEKEILLVTKDREVIDNCKKYGVDSISVFDFYDVMQNVLFDNIQSNINDKKGQGVIHKYETIFDIDMEYDSNLINNQELDLLMEQSFLNSCEDYKKDSDLEQQTRKSKSKKISKKEKRIYKKLKKL